MAKDFLTRANELTAQGLTRQQVADTLNKEGFTAPSGGPVKQWTVTDAFIKDRKTRRAADTPRTRLRAANAPQETAAPDWKDDDSVSSFAVSVLTNQNFDSDKKIRLLNAFFDIA